MRCLCCDCVIDCGFWCYCKVGDGMKPRIRYLYASYLWVCGGQGRSALGDTPKQAYYNWCFMTMKKSLQEMAPYNTPEMEAARRGQMFNPFYIPNKTSNNVAFVGRRL